MMLPLTCRQKATRATKRPQISHHDHPKNTDLARLKAQEKEEETHLQLSGHESLLTVELAILQVHKGVVGHVDGDIGLWLGRSLGNSSLLCIPTVGMVRMRSDEGWERIS